MPTSPSLPVLPVPHARALAALQDPDGDIAELAVAIEGDPALTMAVLRAANSAASAPVNRVDRAERAIMRIGFNATRRIVTGAVVGSSFGDIERAGIDSDELWRHTVACAIVTEQALRSQEASSAGFPAGLLHDIGRIAMAQSAPELYVQVLTLSRQGADVRDAEVGVFGYDHQQFGADIAREWQIPDGIVEAIADHHGGLSGPLSRAVRKSRVLVHALGYGDGVSEPRPLADGEPKLNRDGQLLLSSIGGVEALRTRVDWFRNAMAGAEAARRLPRTHSRRSSSGCRLQARGWSEPADATVRPASIVAIQPAREPMQRSRTGDGAWSARVDHEAWSADGPLVGQGVAGGHGAAATAAAGAAIHPRRQRR